MANDSDYTPPKIWTWTEKNGGTWASTNRPTAEPTHSKKLPVGNHPIQLYSMATPNGVKVTVMLEELLELGFTDAEYDAYVIDIGKGEQFSDGFIHINPNAKIPALIDISSSEPARVFESASILMYLAEKFDVFIPQHPVTRAECLSWLFWQMGSAPYLGGGFGHFYAYAPIKIEYAIDRFTMEVKRQLDVLNIHLKDKTYICGDDYSIADIAIWPWYGVLVLGKLYDAAEFLDVSSYQHVLRWANTLNERPAVQRGRMVNRTWGKAEEQLHERHSADDFQTRTQDKLEPDSQ